MRFGIKVFAPLALLMASVAAHADNVINYTFQNATFGTNGTITGSFSIDYTNQTYQDLDITFSFTDATWGFQTYTATVAQNPDLPNFGPSSGGFNAITSGYNNTDNNVATLSFGIPSPYGSTPVLRITPGMNGPGSSVFYGPHGPGYSGSQSLTGGSLIATPAPTPEPSSLALLGTGVLGVAGTMRRRFKSAR